MLLGYPVLDFNKNPNLTKHGLLPTNRSSLAFLRLEIAQFSRKVSYNHPASP